MRRVSSAAMADSPESSLLPAPPSAKQRMRKTRYLPSLSDCHCCNRRIDSTNHKNRLRILNSEWRIVLLCNSCHSLVESSQRCSYCLTGVSSSSMDPFFECKRCHRRIHRSCVQKFSLGPGNGSDFSVCFDCWVPELLENNYNRVRGSRTKKKAKFCEDSTTLWSSRVCDKLDKGKSLEETVNEANVVAQKKLALAVAAKEKAANKAVIARRAVELASGALSVVAVDKSGGQERSAVDDDTHLAIRLHRAMNSSPRISRNLCLLSNCSTNVPTFRKSAIAEVGRDASIMDADSMSCGELNGLCLTATRQECMQMTCGMRDEKCNGDSNDCLITYSRRGRAPQDGRCEKGPSNFPFRICARRLACVERHNAERDHCFRTYSRRPLAISYCKNRLQYGAFNFEHGVITSAIGLNCCKESRAFANAS